VLSKLRSSSISYRNPAAAADNTPKTVALSTIENAEVMRTIRELM
jgi:hypothetical protein